MTTTPIYLLAAAWGLAGGFSHCIGMCGIFVVSYAGMPAKGDARRFVHPERHLLFHGGRLLSLAALGVIGGALGDLSHRWAAVQGAVGVAIGLLMVGLALGMAGILPWLRIPEPDVLGAGGGRGRRLRPQCAAQHPGGDHRGKDRVFHGSISVNISRQSATRNSRGPGRRPRGGPCRRRGRPPAECSGTSSGC